MSLEVSRLVEHIEPLSGLDRQESVTLQRQMKFLARATRKKNKGEGERGRRTEFMLVQRAVNDVAIENKTRNNEFLSGLGLLARRAWPKDASCRLSTATCRQRKGRQ